jgi:hypothetical protein
MAEHIVTLTKEEETYLVNHGSTLDGIITGLRTEWARAMASEAKQTDFETWQKVKDSEIVKNAVEVELGAQAEAAAAVESKVTSGEPQ